MAVLSAVTLLLAAVPPAPPTAPAEIAADLGVETVDIGFDFTLGPAWAFRDGVSYFYFDDGIHGVELWRSDGSALGTYLLRDLCPGSCSGGLVGYWEAPELAVAGGLLYFAANDGVHGSELWVTDGSALGTRMVRQIRPGIASSSIGRLTALGSQLFFIADDGEHGTELWRSDGTAKGTYLAWDSTPGDDRGVTDILPGPGWLWLRTVDRGLWRYDGTPEGTVRLAESDYGLPATDRQYLGVLPSGRLIYFDEDGLASSDGTEAGTGSFHPGVNTGNDSFRVDGDIALFNARAGAPENRTVFRTEGTAGATEDSGFDVAASALAWGPLAQLDNGTLIVSGREATVGSELWAVPPAGPPHLLADANPGSADAIDFSSIYGVGAWKQLPDRVVYLADDGVRGLEPWVTDGTIPGTYPLPELVPGPAGVSTGYFHADEVSTHLPGPLFIRHAQHDAVRLAVSDGTVAGTRNLRAIGTQRSVVPRPWPWLAACHAPVGPRLVVTTGNELGQGRPLIALAPGPSPSVLIPSLSSEGERALMGCARLGDELLVLQPGTDSESARLWRSDGSVPGTLAIVDVPSRYHPRMLDRGGDLVWAAEDSIWHSDGTVSGTGMLVETAFPPQLFGVNGALVLTSEGVLRDDQLEPVGNFRGFVEAVPFDSGFLVLSHAGRWALLSGRPSVMTAIGITGAEEVPEDLYFPPPWAAGSIRLSAPLDATRALVAVHTEAHGLEVWRTDGTETGSSLVADLAPGAQGSEPTGFVQLRDGAVAFVADDGVHGRELWVSDGTVSGTQLLDLVPGAASSLPQALEAIDGVLLFSAWSEAHGREAYWSDGTLAGTVRISDIAGGPLSSSPERFVRAGRRLFFQATDQVRGFEWWSIDVPAWAGLFADGFESGETGEWSTAVP